MYLMKVLKSVIFKTNYLYLTQQAYTKYLPNPGVM